MAGFYASKVPDEILDLPAKYDYAVNQKGGVSINIRKEGIKGGLSNCNIIPLKVCQFAILLASRWQLATAFAGWIEDVD